MIKLTRKTEFYFDDDFKEKYAKWQHYNSEDAEYQEIMDATPEDFFSWDWTNDEIMDFIINTGCGRWDYLDDKIEYIKEPS